MYLQLRIMKLLNLRFFWLPEVKKIAIIPPPHPLVGLNRIFWAHITNESFSVKSAHQIMKKDMWSIQDNQWRVILKISRITPRLLLSMVGMQIKIAYSLRTRTKEYRTRFVMRSLSS